MADNRIYEENYVEYVSKHKHRSDRRIENFAEFEEAVSFWAECGKNSCNAIVEFVCNNTTKNDHIVHNQSVHNTSPQTETSDQEHNSDQGRDNELSSDVQNETSVFDSIIYVIDKLSDSILFDLIVWKLAVGMMSKNI